MSDNEKTLWKHGSHVVSASGNGAAAEEEARNHLGGEVVKHPVNWLYRIQDEAAATGGGGAGSVACPTGQVATHDPMLEVVSYTVDGVVKPNCIHIKPNGMIPPFPLNPQTMFMRKATPDGVSIHRFADPQSLARAIHDKPTARRHRLIAELGGDPKEKWLLVDQPATSGH